MIDAPRSSATTAGNLSSPAITQWTLGFRESACAGLTSGWGAGSCWVVVFLGIIVWCSAALGVRAGEVTVPNGSFESPSTNYVSVIIDDWVKPPKPDWYQEGGGFLWTQLTGLFRNPISPNPSHIDNMDGDQALWLFAVPEVGLVQELGAPRTRPERMSCSRWANRIS